MKNSWCTGFNLRRCLNKTRNFNSLGKFTDEKKTLSIIWKSANCEEFSSPKFTFLTTKPRDFLLIFGSTSALTHDFALHLTLECWFYRNCKVKDTITGTRTTSIFNIFFWLFHVAIAFHPCSCARKIATHSGDALVQCQHNVVRFLGSTQPFRARDYFIEDFPFVILIPW